MPLPGTVDETLGEFWVGNPWQIISDGHNLSSFERNRMYLNVGGKEFLDVSHLSGADSDGDGRSAVAADFRNTGMPDLIVRQVGGGALQYFENRMPPAHALRVTLRGEKSNRQGVGARVTARVGARTITREMYPANGYRSQSPNQVHIGLGADPRIDELTVAWPSGTVQTFRDVAADRHVVIDEAVAGDAAVELVTPGQTIRP